MRDSPRVCLCTFRYPPMRGGVAWTSARVAQFLAEGGYDVHVCVFTETPDAVPMIASATTPGITVYWHVLSSAAGEMANLLERTLDMAEVLLQLDAEKSFDLFHGVFLPAAHPCLQVARRGRRPVIASARGSDATVWPRESGPRSIIASVLRHADYITAPSQDSLLRLQEIVDVESKSIVVLNSVEEPAHRWRLEPANAGVVGTVAEFYAVKRIPLLVESYAAVPRDVRRQLLLVGDFPTANDRRDALQAIENCRVAEEVRITGYLPHDEAMRQLQSMRVFV